MYKNSHHPNHPKSAPQFMELLIRIDLICVGCRRPFGNSTLLPVRYPTPTTFHEIATRTHPDPPHYPNEVRIFLAVITPVRVLRCVRMSKAARTALTIASSVPHCPTIGSREFLFPCPLA